MQHPANPIPDTYEEVPGYPKKLKICRIPASPFWYARTWMSDKTIMRSTKTDQRKKAQQAAREFYDELLLRKSKKEPLTQGSTFALAADALLEHDKERVERGERKESLVRDGAYLVENELKPFFKNDHIKTINFARINAYVKHLKTRGKKPVGSNTIRNHLIFLRKVLKHAHKLDLLDKLPIFPTISTVDNPREWFTDEQYTLVLETCTKCEGWKNYKKKVHKPITKELRLISAFLVNTFLRPPDLKSMRNKDITVVAGDDGTKYLRISAASKTLKRDVISMPKAVTVLERLTEFNKTLGYGKPNDYLFFPALSRDRSYAFQTLRLQFNHVLEEAGLKRTDDGNVRTLYSLRHSAIMFRLLNGGNVDLFTLAKNCRTSVDMLQRFYVNHLEAEMRVKDLHIQGRAMGRQI
jgi:integrase